MIKVYGINDTLAPIKATLSNTINRSMVEALQFPENKRAHRFFPMAEEDYYYPEGRTNAYIVIEITMILGRSEETRKKLIYTLFRNIEEDFGIEPIDVEIMILESAASNFGFRGITGDEAVLDYKINV